MGVVIREKPKESGIWWIFINHRGRRKAKKVGNLDTAKEAAQKIQARLTLGDLDLNAFNKQAITFGECASLWLSFIKTNRRQSTYERYSNVLNAHILPAFKNRPMDQITRGEIRNFIVEQSKEREPFIYRDILSSIFKYAIDDEVIKANPVSGILRNIARRKRSETVEPLNDADLNSFLDMARASYPEFYPFFFTAARTGMRLGELLALRWADISFNHKIITPKGIEERPYIYVERTYRRGAYTPPKNGKARKVDMSLQLRDILLEHRAKEKRKGMALGLADLEQLEKNSYVILSR